MPDDPSPDTRQPPETAQVGDCDCPADRRIASFYDRRSRKRQGAGLRYEMGGVSKTLLAALLDANPAGRSVLELGCGAGAVIEGLLEAGADRATGVDLSPAVIEEARARLAEAGSADRATFIAADGARVPLTPHDWVVLDKVMCCYPDIARLLANSIPAARRLYAFAVPSSAGWRGALARVAMWVDEAVTFLSRRPCPAYVHDLSVIEGRLREAGFRRRSSAYRSLWYIAVFERSEAAPAT